MLDVPYTSPDEDPFNITPLLLHPRRRRSSMLNKWIKDQQRQPFAADNNASILLPPAHTNPYLAYPELARVTFDARDDLITLNSYDFVQDDDIPHDDIPENEIPATPINHPSSRLHTPSSFRSFSLSFRSSSPAASHAPPDGGSPAPPSRLSFFPRSPRHSSGCARDPSRQHARSTSLSTVSGPSKNSPVPSSPKWRPSVLGHFASSATSQPSTSSPDTSYTPSRPSVSSGRTYTSTDATTVDITSTPPKASFMGSVRSHTKLANSGTQTASSSTIWSQTKGQLCAKENPRPSESAPTLVHGSDNMRTPLAPKPRSRLANCNVDYVDHGEPQLPKHDTNRPHVVYSSVTAHPRVTFSSLSVRHQKKKKKLIISGIGPNDVRKFDNVKRWCENFGEVSQIMRMPNGDLHVDFRRAEVADTVCRLRAMVNISGVGSVHLSWYTGDKR